MSISAFFFFYLYLLAGQLQISLLSFLSCQAARAFGTAHKHPDYVPKLAFVIVQKKHHVRIFTRGQGGLENPKPGKGDNHASFSILTGTSFVRYSVQLYCARRTRFSARRRDAKLAETSS
jgi:hypothetical protein